MDVNPYEPPSIPAEAIEPDWPETGVYTDGSYLILHHAAKLPPICVRTGEPADSECTYGLTGTEPDDQSVPVTRVTFFGTRIYQVQLPVTAKIMSRYRLIQRIAIIAMVLAPLIAAGIWLVAPYDVPPIRRSPGRAELAILGLIATWVTCIILIAETKTFLRLESVARGYFWISKAPKKYLQQLPPWPVPKPSFWRQALYGPAGVPGKPAFAFWSGKPK